MKTLDTIQNELRELIVQGTDLALAALKKTLQPGTDCYNDLLSLEGRYQEVTKQLLQGIVSDEDATLEFNRIRQALIEFVGCLKESDISELKAASEDAQNDIADVYNGEVLYRIPKQMQLGVEEECVIRLAFDRKVLTKDFEVHVGDVMKDLRISNVMGVELLDPAADKAFSITTLNDMVQFVEKDLVTEWIFCVTPLKEGAFPLVLKISIIEIINGIERKRNEVLKEQVQILTKKVEDAAPDFVSAGYGWQVVDKDEKRAVPIGDGRTVPSNIPPSPSPAVPSPSPTTPPPSPLLPDVKKSAGMLGFVGRALAAVVVLVIGGVAVNEFILPKNQSELVLDERAKKLKGLRENPNRQELEAFVDANPSTKEASAAMLLLDSLENAAWNSAVASNDQAAMADYLANYPAGRYSDVAANRIDELNRGEISAIEDAPADTILEVPIEKIPEEKTDNPKPVSPKKKPTTPIDPKPKKTPVVKPTTKPTTPTKPPTPAETKPKPVDPNAPVAMVSAARRPVFKKCGNSNKAKEEKCTTDKIHQFLRGRIEYPTKAMDMGLQGTVVVSFVVERDGSITDVKALNDIGGGCGKEAVRLIQSLPKFKAGLNIKGEPIRVQYTQPVTFKLQ